MEVNMQWKLICNKKKDLCVKNMQPSMAMAHGCGPSHQNTGEPYRIAWPTYTEVYETVDLC